MKRVISVLLSFILAVSVCTGVCVGAKAAETIPSAADSLKAGDLFEYGSYPQTKVTDGALISELNNRKCILSDYDYAMDSDGEDCDLVDMYYADFYYNGIRYRKVVIDGYRPRSADEKGSAESSRQDENGYFAGNTYYFLWEPIVWQVLEKDSTGVYAISKLLLDAQEYNEFYNKTNWSSSSLRSWLNYNFYSYAFDENESAAVLETTNINDNNPLIGTSGGPSTKDKVWILSYSDITKPAYSSLDKSVKGTDYAKSQGIYVAEYYEREEYNGASPWWMRTPDYDSLMGLTVWGDGYVEQGDIEEYPGVNGVRPVFRLSLNASVNRYCNHEFQPKTTLPTCTAQGYTTYVCSRCGYSYQANQVPPKGHAFVNNAEFCVNGCGTRNPNYDASSVLGLKSQIPSLTVSRFKAGKKRFKVTWKKAKGVSGYEVQYSLKKNMKKAKSKQVTKNYLTLKKLKPKKTYFVRIRAYKTVKGVNVYGNWSEVNKVKTK